MKVLDKGYAELIDLSGSVQQVAELSRICYGSAGSLVANENLVKHMITKGHLTPFESIILKFKLKVPVFVARQIHRHRLSTFIEKSGRYTKSFDFYTPASMTDVVKNTYQETCENAFVVYNNLLESGVSKEQARGVLPQSMYTEFYYIVNFRSLLNFLFLRLDKSAQYETREYARAIYTLIPDELKKLVDLYIKMNKPEELL